MEETKQIEFTSGYKYMLEKNAWFYTGIEITEHFAAKRVTHFKDGWMLIKAGFGWDGCSGPTIDDKTNMRAGLMHDGMYYLLRKGFPMKYRKIGDEKLRQLIIEDGMRFKWIPRFLIKLRAYYYKFAVKNFGKGSAEPKNQRKILVAP